METVTINNKKVKINFMCCTTSLNGISVDVYKTEDGKNVVLQISTCDGAAKRMGLTEERRMAIITTEQYDDIDYDPYDDFVFRNALLAALNLTDYQT